MAASAPIKIRPVGAPVGAEVSGVDLSRPLDRRTFRAIDLAYVTYGVPVFRDQRLSERRFLDFARGFGDFHRYRFADDAHPDHPKILILSNVVDRSGRNIGLADGGVSWPTDNSYVSEPPRGTMLYAHEVPMQDGLALGDTCFASAAAAFDALPLKMKQRLDGLRAVFNFAGRKRKHPITQAQIDAFPEVVHPVLRTHPHTGRKCLYIMRDDCTGMTNVPDAEAQLLIAALADHIVRPGFVYRHQWRPGDLLMWDNCTVQHMAMQDYDLPLRRLMHRTTFGASPTF